MRLFYIQVSDGIGWGEPDPEVKAAKLATYAEFKAKYELKDIPGKPNYFIVEEGLLGDILISTKLNQYQELSVDKVELFYDSPVKAFDRLNKFIEQAEARIEQLVGGLVTNAHGFSHYQNGPITGAHLASINDMLLLEDCCTDEVQRSLDKGWRLLAVCPQDARRPDYILGRFIPGYESSRGVARREAE